MQTNISYMFKVSWTFELYTWGILPVYSGHTLLLFIIYLYYLSKKKKKKHKCCIPEAEKENFTPWAGKIELGMSRKGTQKRALSHCSFIKGIPWKY